MPSTLSAIRQLDAQGPAQLPLVANPELAELMVAPYWGPECITDEHETNLPAAASLLAAAWAMTGGRRQHRCCLALLVAGGMADGPARRLLEQGRISLGEPGHALVVSTMRRRLESGIAAGL
ncbi:hypothetical protein OGCDGJMD_01219 [Cyanobium usitatum str. Tous]|uniref:hypothetical protein n=1 Tax=Cyanobium usitatum TaxID=2304190 RepID=UPI002AD3F21F|nr:hypothetical protein [Cyanobium usitatum]CAK6692372.1 hypothetical protein OGCDGJMD_01219 [Cyanobium usitatum str. Tous]